MTCGQTSQTNSAPEHSGRAHLNMPGSARSAVRKWLMITAPRCDTTTTHPSDGGYGSYQSAGGCADINASAGPTAVIATIARKTRMGRTDLWNGRMGFSQYRKTPVHAASRFAGC